MMEENNISPIRSDFEQIKKQNESGSEYWTSRDLCVALGYSTPDFVTQIRVVL